jgi:hypothetical protein
VTEADEDGVPADFQPWTPVRCEQELERLMNAVAKAELGLRKALIAENDARREYERAHVIAAMDPNCPIPRPGHYTVGERESWIRGVCLDEFEGLEYQKLNVDLAKRYQSRIEQQCSLVQSMSRMVTMSYQVVGAQGTGRW